MSGIATCLRPWTVAAVTSAGLALCAAESAVAGDSNVPAGEEEPLPFDPAPPIGPALARVAALTVLGRKLFDDPALSASGRMACASCHDPHASKDPKLFKPVGHAPFMARQCEACHTAGGNEGKR